MDVIRKQKVLSILLTTIIVSIPSTYNASQAEIPMSGICTVSASYCNSFNKSAEYIQKYNSLDTSNTEEWFKAYKELNIEYADYIDPEETIYDYYTEDELNLLFAIVEAEVTGEGWFDEKCNVASVIFARVEDENFDESITDILTKKSQFSSYSDSRYLRVKVTDETILACEYAFQFGGTADGALFFDNVSGQSWASKNKTYMFTDGANHSFYK